MIQRARQLNRVRTALKNNPVVAVLGPRQCGKTTLAQQVAAGKGAVYFDLERATDAAQLRNAELVLSRLRGLVVIDEIQRRPELFETLRPLADRRGTPARFLVLGSASPHLVRGVAESLAGRVGFVDLGGFDMEETGPGKMERLWLRGGFPRSFLAANEAASLAWRADFIRSFVERDLPQLGIRIPSESLHRFWMMMAHYHGQIWNAADLARSLGVSENTARHYLDILTGAYVVRQLQPWWENLGKRQYKAPKVYIRDSGVFHSLQSIESHKQLLAHPKFGASWEGFALEQVLGLFGGEKTFFWSTHAGAELDLLLFRHGRRFGVEFKCNQAPVMTRSLHVALNDLKLDRAWIVYPGDETYPVHGKVECIPLQSIGTKLSVLR